ncbi:Cytoplasmic thioredoxin isoenzyme 2 [Orbilia brochopaga]|uniref:Thioredoxin n=1 Tax=Orbilia brochopaga TaxID=3140254 RepID=A0AAV9UHI7_9PEZI
MVKEIKSYGEFRELIAEDKVTVIYFHAVWCGPCRIIGPFVEKLEREYTDAAFYKLDVDEVVEASQECAIRVIPTSIIFRKGEKVEDAVGANPPALENAVVTALAHE